LNGGINMEKIMVAVIGYGNVGRFAVDAILEEPDMELSGVIVRSRRINEVKKSFPNINVSDKIEDINKPNVVLLCVPSVDVPKIAKEYLKKGVNVIDSYDIHGESLINMKLELDQVAKSNGAVSVSGAGWDPGADSVIRVLFEVMAPKGITYTNFGPGVSLGHSVEAKKAAGVKDAISITIPKGEGVHRRVVYVELAEGASIESVTKGILANNYFTHDETHVISVKSVKELMDQGHGVSLTRKGVASGSHNQRLKWELQLNNPAATAQVMVSSARASLKLEPGNYMMVEIPPIKFLSGNYLDNIKRLV
jgi:diaminopimelate dehydrogenase